jgi:HD-GYP domain-containing protein (c-di-GMP phosphodiesterase class II)
MAGSASYLHLRFALVSLALAGLAGVLAVLASREVVRDNEQRAAAQSASRLFAGPLQSLFAEVAASGLTSLSPDQEDRAESLASTFVPSELYSLRVFATDGRVIFATDGSTEAQSPVRSSDIAWSSSDVGGAPAFTTWIDEGSYIVQLTEDGRPIEATISQQQRAAITTTVIAVGIFYLLLQGAFWLVVRGVVSDNRRLVRLYVAGEELRSSLDLEEVLSQLTRGAAVAANAQYSLVALYDHDTGDMLLRCTYDREAAAVVPHQRPVEEWLMRRCVITNTNIIAGQAADAFHQFFTALNPEGQVNVLCVPMSLRDRVIGVIAILKPATTRRMPFAMSEVRQVADLAIQGAMAVEQAQLFAKVRKYADEVELSYDSTLKALTAALDAKDDVTEGHCERVSRLTAQLARSMGVAERQLVDIERGALLHDVGKIGVPDAVLQKPSALDDMEWEAIRKHPLLAGVMISKVGFLEGTTPILLYHHERFDGTGYPFGLSGDRIPLDARIFSVVDAYDAITSDRPYRAARSHEEAMIEIAQHSGSQFDPAVVASFQRLMTSSPELRARPPVRSARRSHGDDDQPMLAEPAA